MNTILLFDDSVPVAAHARQMAGLKHYGDLLFRGERAADRYEAAARQAGWAHFERIVDARQIGVERSRIAEGNGGEFYLYFPAALGWQGSDADLAEFLANLLLGRVEATAGIGNARLVCGGSDVAGRVLAGLQAGRPRETIADLPQIRVPQQLVDLGLESHFVTSLASAFSVRHFNAIESDAYLVRKSSTDRAKLKAEFDYLGLIPADMRMYFVGAFDFRDDGTTASYAMERLFVPDLAIQWIHGAIDIATFGRLLDRLFHFLQLRAQRGVDPPRMQQVADALYLNKLETRIERLMQMPQWPSLATLIARMEGVGDGLEGLLARFRRLYARIGRRKEPAALAVGHGDLCFSNILYGREADLMKFIDARGASDAESLYTDRYYDLAKLSHSILGGYDFINNGLFSIEVDDALKLRMHARGARPDGAFGRMFLDRVVAAGYNERLVRLYEASLFLSMLPLHIDHPRKLLAFVATAHAILADLDAGRESHSA